MQYIVIGYDGHDEEAPARRQAVRGAHLKLAEELVNRGKWLYACAILDDKEQMIGSMILCDFPTRKELDQWLEKEPYILGGVWKEITIRRARVPDFVLNK